MMVASYLKRLYADQVLQFIQHISAMINIVGSTHPTNNALINI